MRCISALAPPCSQAPGPGYDGLLAMPECENALTIAMARAGSSRAVASKASLTFIGYAVPTITRPLARSGARDAASSAISEPMLWPTRCALATPAASSKASSQSADASMLASGGPAERPCPGWSTASTR